jgi:hypothetical protein
MNRIFLGIGITLMSACFSQAQNKVSVPLLGSKQIVESSEFCKKYKCKAMLRENGLGYVLELPGDDTWSDIMSYPDSKGKTQPQLWQDYRTLMNVDMDRKTGQITSIDFQLRENFRSNIATRTSENQMLVDAIYHIVGKRLILDKSQREFYSMDIDDCFVSAKRLARDKVILMMTGKVMLQVDRREAKYYAICSANSNGSTPKMYWPAFWIEIRSFTDTIPQSGN